MIKPIKQKKCRICKDLFTPKRAIQPCCDKYECNVEYAIAVAQKAAIARAKKELRVHKEKVKALKPRSKYLAETQRFFNIYIRERDKHLGCISCGTTTSNQYCAGHYKTVGSAPHLRFDERNAHKQCNRYCNMELSGNIIKYRQALIKKIGIEAVEQLEADNTPKHYTIPEIQQIKILYKQKTKALKEALPEQPARLEF